MELRAFIVSLIITLSLSVTSAMNSCDVRDRKDCIYTVVCETYAGNAYTPECESEPYVTFVITKSTVENTLTSGFFGSTNFDNRVRYIKAIENVWPYIESYTFRYYVKTLIMDISGNAIENIRNEAFRNLYLLTSLNISNNVIQSLNPNTFLMSENKVPALEILDLSNNYLTDLSGDSFNSLLNLQKLYLQHNKLMILSDSTFYYLKGLIVLNLSNNKISALNTTLAQLKSLKELYLSFNQLTQIFGIQTNRLIALETVNMSHNSIEIVESNCFNQAFNLLILDLSHNKINHIIDNLMFINNNKLNYLDFYDNNITHIQDNAFQHNALQFLDLDKNHLTGEITGNTLSGLKNLTSLNLSKQNLTAVRKDAFSDAANLVYLNLSQNYIQFIENSSMNKALAMNILDVSNNNVSNVSFLRNSLAKLSEIYLQGNHLVKIPKDAFKDQTLLTKLDLSQNMIEKIEQNALSLQSLQYLFVHGNRLAGDLESNVFSPAKFLRFLDLSNFKLKRINKMALVDLPVLARLNVSHNYLEYIDPNNFFGMDNMYSLDLSYNKLSCFHLNKSSLINLKALYLNNNNLSNISRTLINMTELLYVDLSSNNISDLSDVPFTSLQNLKVLHLSHNNIRHFNNPLTNSLVKLTDLSLAGNQLTEINLSHFKDLVIVDISKNKITFINSTFFENLDYLQSIDLSSNSVTQINPGTFQKVKILKLLNLSQNRLTTLRYGSFRGLNRTEVLDLSYNSLADIDVDVFHECNELKRLTIDYNRLQTLDVERLISILPKLITLSIGGNPLSCKEIVRNIKSVNRNLIRQVEVTAVDKIYHEDNVHGIKCGDSNETMITEKPDNKQEGDYTSFGLVIWCSLLTVIILVSGAVLFLYKHKLKAAYFYEGESRLQLSNSESRFSDTNDSLLG